MRTINPYLFRWTVTDAHMIMKNVQDTAEWVRPKPIWRIDLASEGSTVHLTHMGLTPSLPCYDICKHGWQHIFETSLLNHLNGQMGAPTPPDDSTERTAPTRPSLI